MQNITSKNTALNQVASTFKAFNFDNCLVLDYGCGKGMSKEFCEKTYNNCKVFLYDPFHGFDEVGAFLEKVKRLENGNKNKVITCNNVLNVLQDHVLKFVVSHIAILAEYYMTDVIFKIYEGDRSGIGRITKNDCYQRNEKTESYVTLIDTIVNNGCHYDVKRKGQYVICKRL